MALLDKVAVVGLGTIGGEIGPYLARRGSTVYGIDPDARAIERAKSSGAYAAVYGLISELPRGISTVIEAVTEDPLLKGYVLTLLSEKVPQTAPIVMVSSTIPSSTYSGRIKNPSRLMNGHILPDLTVRRFIELQGPGQKYTNRKKLEEMAGEFSEKGFTAVIVNGESPGFIFNQIWHNVMFKMFELMKDYNYADIECSWRDFFGMPYGGVMAMDLIGHDTLYRVFKQVEAKMGINVPQVIAEMNAKGTFGLKSGKGFFEYDTPDLDGLHKAALEFSSKYGGNVKTEIGEAIWSTIQASARKLVKNGQEREAVMKAVKHGCPITREDLLEELFM